MTTKSAAAAVACHGEKGLQASGTLTTALARDTECPPGPAAESAAISHDGSLWMSDRNGTVLRAAPTGAGGFAAPPADAGHVGGGRTLGQHFDSAGNLIFCHAAVVRCPLF